MNNKKSTKRALISSILSLALCMTMLIGTTFAWFTDSVTSTNNIIKSGKLDVELNYKNKITDNWSKVSDQEEAIFNYDKWEPGYVDVKYIQVANVGNLAFKYLINIIPKTIISAGEVNLADVIDVYIVKNPTEGLTRDSIATMTKVGTLTSLMTDPDGAARGILLPKDGSKNVTLAAEDQALAEKEQVTLGIALKMQESAGNEYQDKTVGGGFDIQLLATQYTWENDSFNNQYDAFADYDGQISTADALNAALAKGGTYKLLSDITLEDGDVLTIDNGVSVALDLSDKKIVGNNTGSAGAVIVNNGALTIAGGNISNTVVNGAAVINNKGTLVLDGATIEGAPIGTTGYPAYAVTTSGKLTVEEGTIINASRGAISTSNGAEVVINGGSFVVSDAADGRNMTLHTIYAYGYNTKLTINDGYFEQNHTSTGGASVICPAGATINIYGGDFRDAMDDTNWTSTGNFQNYMGYGAPVNVYGGTFDDETVKKNLANGYVAAPNVDGIYTVVEGKAVNSSSEFKETITSGEEKVVLSAGNYSMPDGSDISLVNEPLTIIGTKDTVIDVSNIDARDQFVTGATLVFEGVTLNFGVENYMGFANTSSLTYKNCKLTGLQFLYGENVTFENCIIDSSANTKEPHSVWTYGAKNVTFTNCEFIYGNRGINCYSDDDIVGGKQVVNFNDCTFTTTDTNSEGAVEINSCYFSVGIEVNLKGCTAPAHGEMAYISQWDSTHGAKTTINIK